MKKLLFIGILLSFGFSLHAGGPWPQKKGNLYFKVSEWWLVFNQHYTDQGLIDPNVTTGLYNTTIYAEYGLTNRLTGTIYAPLLSRNYMNNLVSNTTKEVIVPGEAINNIGDVDISLKYAINKKFPVSISLTLGLPTGIASAGSQQNLQTGDGEFNQMLQIDAGQGFNLSKGVSAYFSTYGGFNNRSNGFSDEVRYGLEGGLSFIKNRLWIIGRVNGVESLKNGETAETFSSTSIFSNNSEYTSYGAEVALYVTKRVGFSASVASAFRGEIIAAAPSYSVGFFYDMSK
ncbi:hypothetical protein [Portibacter lacus]|uniref:Transporter n=1 Tax=Portibacter lacus TaxID=1099794 RepID=A0AA37WC56_9BACT|nr:hypothetical protein [Portibacter lacus]GLR16136.1 hypothetical protein GCM10007940_07510 [Portibacter lacus]